MQWSYVELIIKLNGFWVKPPAFLPLQEMIPIMPFHTILLENFRCILLFVGPNLRTQSKRLNMERPSRGSAQMLACCSSAPAASTSQQGDHTDGQTPTTTHPPPKKHPSDPRFPLRDKPSEDCRSPVQRRHPGATEPELGLLPSPIFIVGKWDTHHHPLQAPLLLALSKKIWVTAVSDYLSLRENL